MTTPSSRLAALAALFLLVGAGCATTTPTTQTPARLGFGKLPNLAVAPPTTPSTQTGTLTETAPRDLSAGQTGTAAASGIAAPSIGIAVPSKGTMVRPIPSPYPSPRPVVVEYSIDAPLPSWGAASDVLLAHAKLPDAAAVGGFAQSAGLPSQALGSSDTITSVNLQWTDADKFQWTFDAGNRTVSFWKSSPVSINEKPTTQPANASNDELVRIADAFLDAHGFSAVRQSGGNVEETSRILPMMKGGVTGSDSPSYPCPMMGATATPPSAKGAATATIYPYPCGGWQETATVVYGGMREGRAVTDAYGNPQQSATVTIALATKQVAGGNLQLDQNVDRSSYPLIDIDSAKKRLQSGGRNPIWPWGSETGTIKVHLTKIDVVWMRFDNWANGVSETYFIPGLRATGTVDRGVVGSSPEDYQTVIPLVDDSAFDQNQTSPSPVPLPATGGGGVVSGGVVSGGAVEILPSTAPVKK